MEWTDDAIVLSVRRHGESSAIAELLTREHGRHGGLIRGGSGRQYRGFLQTGNLVRASWRARLPEHLGTLVCEPLKPVVSDLMDDPLRLAALSAACAVAHGALPERQPCPTVYDGLNVLLGSMTDETWPSVFVKWELGLLGELGFALDLVRCAATGRSDQLAFVSPKTGRAVSRSAGEPYKNLLLPLPAFLTSNGHPGNAIEVVDGLTLTGYFLERHVFGNTGGLPPARRRFAERLMATGRG